MWVYAYVFVSEYVTLETLKFWNKSFHGTSLAVQWLRLHPSNAGGAGSIPGWGTEIPHAAWCGQKIKLE